MDAVTTQMNTPIDDFVQDARRFHSDLLAVLVTRVGPNSLFTESFVPESKPRRNVLTILGHIFSQDVADDYRIFGLIDLPIMSKKENTYAGV